MKTKKFIFIILGGLLCLNIFAWVVVYDLDQAEFLEVNFFDVGQGDSIFIETPERHQILIDGGPTSVILEKLAKALPFYDRSIDLIILTHPDYDHLSGLIEVLKRYKVENILWTGVKENTAEYEEWMRVVGKEKAKIIIARAGQLIDFVSQSIDDNQPQYIEVLHPFESLENQEAENSNNTSIVTRLVFGETSFLFTGDSYKSVEKKLIENDVNLDSDILKIGHHGSRNSSSEEFIEKISPEIAVISVGKDNKYRHPHQEVLDMLARYGITVLRTDQRGDIKIISNGKKYAVSNFQN